MIITANYDGPPYASPTSRVIGAPGAPGLAGVGCVGCPQLNGLGEIGDSPTSILKDTGAGLGTILLVMGVIGGAAWFYTKSRGDKGMLKGAKKRKR